MSSVKTMKLNDYVDLKARLLNNYGAYLPLVEDPNIDAVEAILQKSDYAIMVDGLNINFPNLNPDNTWEAGYENSIKIYESFGGDSFPLQLALDEKFWVYLTFVQYRVDYMLQRWPLSEDGVNRLASRYFFGKNPERRHELARLYWIPHLTVQPEKTTQDEKYELTKIAFEYADPSSAIIERNLGRNPKIVRASMRAIVNNQDQKNIKSRAIFGRFAKKVNNLAGSVIIDYLDEDEMSSKFTLLLREELENY